MNDFATAAIVTLPDSMPALMLGVLAVGLLLYSKAHFSERARLTRLRAILSEVAVARDRVALPVADHPRLFEHLSGCERKARWIAEYLDAEQPGLVNVRDEAQKLSHHLHGLAAVVRKR
jgi:hypothetical protein